MRVSSPISAPQRQATGGAGRTAFAVPLLGDRVGWRRWAAIAIGMAAVWLVLRPWAIIHTVPY